MARAQRLNFTANLLRLLQDARATGAMIITSLAGCAGTITMHDPELGQRTRMTREEFGQYVETVFRHQNRVQTRAMMMLADADADSNEWQTLQAAEGELMKACRSLNRLAAAEAGGERPSRLALRGLPDEVAACHRQSLRLESLLDAHATSE